MKEARLQQQGCGQSLCWVPLQTTFRNVRWPGAGARAAGVCTADAFLASSRPPLALCSFLLSGEVTFQASLGPVTQ